MKLKNIVSSIHNRFRRKEISKFFSLFAAVFFLQEIPLYGNEPLVTMISPSTPVIAASQPAPTTLPSSPLRCSLSKRSMHVDFRHIEGNGVGYDKGYSTMEAFFAPRKLLGSILPFVDLRGHIFNDGTYAANGGMGMRCLFPSTCLALGGNVFYDYRHSRHHDYNQVGAGLELLGARWDLHINGYLPFWKKKSRPFHRREAISGLDVEIGDDPVTFSHFAGHNAFLNSTTLGRL